MARGRFLWRGEWHHWASRALLLAAARVTVLARPSAVSSKSLNVEQFVAHKHWLSICACPRRVHANRRSIRCCHSDADELLEAVVAAGLSSVGGSLPWANPLPPRTESPQTRCALPSCASRGR